MGGAREDRTSGFVIANDALSLLSYAPKLIEITGAECSTREADIARAVLLKRACSAGSQLSLFFVDCFIFSTIACISSGLTLGVVASGDFPMVSIVNLS